MAEEKKRSLSGLDWVNFFMADVNTGIGPFLAIYLTATRHWDAASVGLVVSAQSVASVLAQAPAGFLVDNSKNKKWLVITGAFVVALGCIGIVLAPGMPWEIGNQIIIGLTAALFAPAISAIALGLVEKPKFSGRAGRNGRLQPRGECHVRTDSRGYRGGVRTAMDLLCLRSVCDRNNSFSLDDSE